MFHKDKVVARMCNMKLIIIIITNCRFKDDEFNCSLLNSSHDIGFSHKVFYCGRDFYVLKSKNFKAGYKFVSITKFGPRVCHPGFYFSWRILK